MKQNERGFFIGENAEEVYAKADNMKEKVIEGMKKLGCAAQAERLHPDNASGYADIDFDAICEVLGISFRNATIKRAPYCGSFVEAVSGGRNT